MPQNEADKSAETVVSVLIVSPFMHCGSCSALPHTRKLREVLRLTSFDVTAESAGDIAAEFAATLASHDLAVGSCKGNLEGTDEFTL